MTALLPPSSLSSLLDLIVALFRTQSTRLNTRNYIMTHQTQQQRSMSVTPAIRVHGQNLARCESVQPAASPVKTRPQAPPPAIARIKSEDHGAMLPPALIPNSKSRSSSSAIAKTSANHAIKRMRNSCVALKQPYLPSIRSRSRSRTPSVSSFRRSDSRAPSRARSIAPPVQSQQEQDQRETENGTQQQRREASNGPEQREGEQRKLHERRKALANAIDLDQYPSSASSDEDNDRMDRDKEDEDEEDEEEEEEEEGRPILLRSPTPTSPLRRNSTPSPSHHQETSPPPPPRRRNIRLTIAYNIEEVIIPTDPSSSTSQIAYEQLHLAKFTTDPFFSTVFDSQEVRRRFDAVRFDEEMKRFCQRRLN